MRRLEQALQENALHREYRRVFKFCLSLVLLCAKTMGGLEQAFSRDTLYRLWDASDEKASS